MERFEVIDSIGPAKVSAAELGPIWVTTSVIVWVVSVGIAEQPEDRDQGDQGRKQRQQAVVGERRGPVGHVIFLELERGALQRRPQSGALVGALGGVVGADRLDVLSHLLVFAFALALVLGRPVAFDALLGAAHRLRRRRTISTTATSAAPRPTAAGPPRSAA